VGFPKKNDLAWLLKGFSGVPISREFPIPGFFQESGIIEYSHFPVPDLLPRDTTLLRSLQLQVLQRANVKCISGNGLFGTLLHPIGPCCVSFEHFFLHLEV
jgi:hypothetical protein